MVKSLVQFHTSLPRDQIQPLLDRLAKINEHLTEYAELEILPPSAVQDTSSDPELSSQPLN